MPFSSSSSSSYLSLLSCSFLVVDVAVEERFPFNLSFSFWTPRKADFRQVSHPSHVEKPFSIRSTGQGQISQLKREEERQREFKLTVTQISSSFLLPSFFLFFFFAPKPKRKCLTTRTIQEEKTTKTKREERERPPARADPNCSLTRRRSKDSCQPSEDCPRSHQRTP